MRYCFPLLILSFFNHVILLGQKPGDRTTAFDHLVTVNPHWEFHQKACPETIIQFDKDEDRIAYHLQLVAERLGQTALKNLSKKSIEKRNNLLGKLTDYASAKQFPINKYPTRQPCFIDDQGTYCAVCFLMAASGYELLAKQISYDYNNNYLHEMPIEKIAPWATKHGFSIEELAWIQPTYMAVDIYTPFLNGPNGTVHHIKSHRSKTILAGTFTKIGGSPCNQIGYFNGKNDFYCLGSKLSGQINDVLSNGNKLYIVGKFHHNGTTYPIASYESESFYHRGMVSQMASYETGYWRYYEIPGRKGAEGTLVFNPEFPNHLGVVLRHSSIPGKEEIWYYDDNDYVWEKKLTVNGSINAENRIQSPSLPGKNVTSYRDSNNGNKQRITINGVEKKEHSFPDAWLFGGSFDKATIHAPGKSDQTIACKNLILKENSTNNWQALGTEVSDTVKAILTMGSSAYIAGSCSSNGDVCLTRLLHKNLQPLIIYDNLVFNDKPCDIRALTYFEDKFILAGNFFIRFSGMQSNHIAELDLLHNYLKPLPFLDQPINVLANNYNSGGLFLGGEFTRNVSNESPLPYFAKQESKPHPQYPLVVPPRMPGDPTPIYKEGSIEINLNPLPSFVAIDGLETEYTYSIFDESGNKLQSGFREANTPIDLSDLPNGIFQIKMSTEAGSFSTKFIKGKKKKR